MRKLLILANALFLTTALNLVSAAANQDVEIMDPYARAVPPGQPNSAVFMQLKNNSSQEQKIVNAKSSVAAIVELHTHSMSGGMMRMRRIDSIDVPAKGETELKPGGLHIMLINLYEDLKAGESIDLEIEFADGSKSNITAPIRDVMGRGMMKHGESGHGGMQAMGGSKGHGKHGKKGHKGHNNKPNPMPNLMKIVKKHGDVLNLTQEQQDKLAEWRKTNHDRMHEMMEKVTKLEADIKRAALAGESKAELLKMADEVMAVRRNIIMGKIDCRDNMQSILTPEQFGQVIALYKVLEMQEGKNKHGSHGGHGKKGKSCKH